jgi:hypothetical protein
VLPPAMGERIQRMQQFIARVLGDYDVFIGDLPRLVRLTSGASATRSRRQSLPFMKLSRVVDCTNRCAPYVRALYRFYGYKAPRIEPTVCNRVEYVPKNWKTHRTIACEPTGNLPFQLAFDTWVKRHLKKFGIDLADQSRNQELARIGSEDGTLCTVDLSAASDTVSVNAVAALLPEAWTSYLMDVRSPAHNVGDNPREYGKISSMGNGATFALETLIFASACYALRPNTFSVYGDDIIIDSNLYQDLVDTLSLFGFRVNLEKSFSSGPFRESCGADWYRGRLITPFYIRRWPRGRADFAHLVNGLVSVSRNSGHVWELCRSLVTELGLLRVPYNHDTRSGVFIDNHSAYACKLIRRFNGRKPCPDGHFLGFKGYVEKRSLLDVVDSRTLALWYLARNGQVTPDFRKPTALLPNLLSEERRQVLSAWVRDPTVTSGTPSSRVKRASRWAYWHPPVGAVPSHLFWWADFLARTS